GAYGAAIAALFQKAEFELQHFQQVAIVFRHTSLHRWIWRGSANGGKPFSSLAAILGARVPTGCDFYHSPQCLGSLCDLDHMAAVTAWVGPGVPGFSPRLDWV